MAYEILTFGGKDVLNINNILTEKRDKFNTDNFKFERAHEDERNGNWIEDYTINGVDVSFVYNQGASELKIYLLSNFSSDRDHAKSALEKILGMKLEN